VQHLSAEAINTFKTDLRCINEGLYKLPWDMTTPTHRQYNPFWVIQEYVNVAWEAADVMGRLRNSQGASPTFPLMIQFSLPSRFS
jgi:hypothetical protein